MRHREAFALMQYKCAAGHVELIWNSRDGVTPFCVTCATCGALSEHVRWREDRVEHGLPQGVRRYFRDGIPEEAAAIMRARIDRMRGEYPITDEQAEALIAGAREGEEAGEFSPGWPILVRVGSDADTVSYPTLAREGA